MGPLKWRLGEDIFMSQASKLKHLSGHPEPELWLCRVIIALNPITGGLYPVAKTLLWLRVEQVYKLTQGVYPVAKNQMMAPGRASLVMVGRQGFEPWKPSGSRFTVCPLCPLGYLPVRPSS